MKPRNFPTRRLRRQARANVRNGYELTQQERAAALTPKDTRIRRGAEQWKGL